MRADLGDFPAGKLRLLLVEISFELFGSDHIDIEMIGLALNSPIAREYEKAFDGITIPTTMRVGWYFGSDRFATEGEFFRVTVDHAEFR